MSSNENSPVPSPEIINPPNVKIRIFNFPSGEWDENIADWIVQTCGGELTEVHNHRRTRGNELYYLCLAYVQDFSSIPDEIIYQSMYDGQFVVIRIEYKPIVM